MLFRVGQWQWTRKGLWQPPGIQCKKESKRETRLLRACGSMELKQVASAMQGLRLVNENVGSKVVGVDRCQLPGRTVEKL